MNKNEELIALQTVIRAMDGNLQTVMQAIKGIEYLLWMHPELKEFEQFEQFCDAIKQAVDEFRDYLHERHIVSERKLEDAIIAIQEEDDIHFSV